mmetsp:Transcript_18596/g.30860  ORF Transcript_18596/g.30860 Transcript_18596/m.30860 type:complete len:91 (+) Transcript_18596:373-645(+)
MPWCIRSKFSCRQTTHECGSLDSMITSTVLKRAMKRSGLFSTISSQLDDLDHDLSSSAIITCDYEGSIRILLRKQLFDDAIKAAGPEGFH